VIKEMGEKKEMGDQNKDVRKELYAEKTKLKELDVKTKCTGEETLNAITTDKSELENLVDDLKRQITAGNDNESTLEHEIKEKESKLIDLQDELETKDLVKKQLLEEMLDSLKSSSSSLADEMELAHLQIENRKLVKEVAIINAKVEKMEGHNSEKIYYLKSWKKNLLL
jgi:chromosome segregation ATPase